MLSEIAVIAGFILGAATGYMLGRERAYKQFMKHYKPFKREDTDDGTSKD